MEKEQLVDLAEIEIDNFLNKTLFHIEFEIF